MSTRAVKTKKKMNLQRKTPQRGGNESSIHDAIKNNRKIIKRGDGIIDKIIDKVPFELHVPGYQYCGPGITCYPFFQSKQIHY